MALSRLVSSYLYLRRNVEGTGNKFVDDFHNGYINFGWDNVDKEIKLSERTITPNNSRAAMMGILRLMLGCKLPGNYPV